MMEFTLTKFVAHLEELSALALETDNASQAKTIAAVVQFFTTMLKRAMAGEINVVETMNPSVFFRLAELAMAKGDISHRNPSEITKMITDYAGASLTTKSIKARIIFQEAV
jgi:hypothetical protein